MVLSRSNDGRSAFNAHRATSTDGVVWTVDSDSTDSNPSGSYPSRLNDGRLVYREGQPQNSALQDLLKRYGLADKLDAAVCFVVISGSTLQVFSCDGGTPTSLSADDLIEPDNASTIFGCAEELVASHWGFAATTLRLIDSQAGQESELSLDVNLLTLPSVLADGTILALSVPVDNGTLENCRGLGIELPEDKPLMLLVYPPESGAQSDPRVFEFDDELARSIGGGFWGQVTAALDEGMLISVGTRFGESIWTVKRRAS